MIKRFEIPKGFNEVKPKIIFRYNKMYQMKEWRTLRKYKLSQRPFCENCERVGVIKKATEVDHKIPFKGENDLDNFLNFLNLVSLCKSCHRSKSQSESNRGKNV